MRLRKIPEAFEIVEKSPYVIHEKTPLSRDIMDFFDSPGELQAEIGTGKGKFIIEKAALHPEIRYIGIERYESVLFRACQALEERDDGTEDRKHTVPENEEDFQTIQRSHPEADTRTLRNLRFLSMDAREMPQYFKSGEISVLYLNFSDPWPKKRHAKRRLTSRSFLDMYEKVLRDGGRLEFKTDNQDLFAFSEEELRSAPHWEITALTHDLHRDPTLSEGNIMTEYERKFSALGNRICCLTAVLHKAETAGLHKTENKV